MDAHVCKSSYLGVWCRRVTTSLRLHNKLQVKLGNLKRLWSQTNTLTHKQNRWIKCKTNNKPMELLQGKQELAQWTTCSNWVIHNCSSCGQSRLTFRERTARKAFEMTVSSKSHCMYALGIIKTTRELAKRACCSVEDLGSVPSNHNMAHSWL